MRKGQCHGFEHPPIPQCLAQPGDGSADRRGIGYCIPKSRTPRSVAAPCAVFKSRPQAQKRRAPQGLNLWDYIDSIITEKLAEAERKTPSRRDDASWYRAFGRQIFEARVKAGVSIEDAAAAAGRSAETWRRYEATGRGRLTWPLVQFARRYGIRLDDLFDGASSAVRRSPD